MKAVVLVVITLASLQAYECHPKVECDESGACTTITECTYN